MKRVLLLVFLFGLQISYAQNNQNSFSITPLQGFTIFAPDNYQLKGNFYGLELAYQLNMSNNNVDWVRILHVKDIAFTASYFNLQSVSTAGGPGLPGFLENNFGLLTILDMSFFKTGKTTFIFSPGIGFAYSTQTYYTNNNPIVGSHINLAIQAGFKIETPISSTTKITAGLDFFHYSNSAYKLPNDGVNNINASLGIVKDINLTGPSRQKATFGIDDKQSFEFGIGIGRRGFIQTGQYINNQTGKPVTLTDSAAQRNATPNLYNAGFYAGYSYRLDNLLSLKIGTDAVYYFKPFSWDSFYRTFQETGTSFDKYSLGISLGTDVWMGRMALSGNYGYYLHYNSIYPVHYYWTLGGKYYLTNWMGLNAKIYLHGFEAQYANFGLVFNVY